MVVFSSQKFKRVDIDRVTVRRLGLQLGFYFMFSYSVPSKWIKSGGRVCVCAIINRRTTYFCPLVGAFCLRLEWFGGFSVERRKHLRRNQIIYYLSFYVEQDELSHTCDDACEQTCRGHGCANSDGKCSKRSHTQ